MSSISFAHGQISASRSGTTRGSIVRRSLPAALTLLLMLGITAYSFYRRDLNAARAAASSGSAMLATACGHIEYAIGGTGSPVLSIHGTGGGFDQGLFIARGLEERGFQVIAPSRYGYLRTPMPQHPTAVREADMFACLLDSLHLQRVAVIAASAGATPALQFALRYPERVSRLILLVPAIGGISAPDTNALVSPFIMNVVLGSDFPFWAALERITVPTLLVSTQDDLYKTLANARVAASRIPNARLIEFQSGGHLMLDQDAELWPAVAEFIRR